MEGLLPPLHLGNGLAYICANNVRVDQEGLPHVYELELDVAHGRLVVTRFCVERRPGGEPITIELLKSVPLVRLAAEAGRDWLGGLVRIEETSPSNFKVTPVDAGEIDALSELERAALFYRVAYYHGDPPTATVARELGISHATAAKRVQAARRAGLLEPTRKGRKGA